MLLRLIGRAIPAGPTGQFTAIRMVEHNLDRVPAVGKRPQVLDFGAGSGHLLLELREVLPDLRYTGIDLDLPKDESPYAGPDVRFVGYDGSHMPFPDNTFDLCFSKQVLEHVRHPDVAVAEIHRTLRPGGAFAGSVSFLEPYHARSIFNWTPYGLVTVLEDHGFEVVEVRPGIDGASMIFRQLYDGRFGRSFTRQSAFNHHIEIEHESDGPKLRNARKLIVTGHLCFFAVKK